MRQSDQDAVFSFQIWVFFVWKGKGKKRLKVILTSQVLELCDFDLSLKEKTLVWLNLMMWHLHTFVKYENWKMYEIFKIMELFLTY